MKKDSMQQKVLDLIRVGTWSKKEIAHQLAISVAAVATHMTYLRWKGHFIIYDLGTMTLQLTNEKGYLDWVGSKRKVAPTSEEICKKAQKKLKTFRISLAKWESKVSPEQLTAQKKIETFLTEETANIFLLKREIKRTMALIKDNLPKAAYKP